MAGYPVTGDAFMEIDDRMREVKRQLRQPGGSPLDPRLVSLAIQDIVEGRFTTDRRTSLPESFVVWRMAHIGRHPTPDGYLASIRAKHNEVGNRWAHLLVPSVRCETEPRDLALIRASFRDIGIDPRLGRRRALACAAALGLRPCPAETALALRDEYQDQPYGECLLVMMDPLGQNPGHFVGEDGFVFTVGHDRDGRWLRTRGADTAWSQGSDSEWVWTETPLQTRT